MLGKTTNTYVSSKPLMDLAFTIRFWFWLWNLGLLIFLIKKGRQNWKVYLQGQNKTFPLSSVLKRKCQIKKYGQHLCKEYRFRDFRLVFVLNVVLTWERTRFQLFKRASCSQASERWSDICFLRFDAPSRHRRRPTDPLMVSFVWLCLFSARSLLSMQ